MEDVHRKLSKLGGGGYKKLTTIANRSLVYVVAVKNLLISSPIVGDNTWLVSAEIGEKAV